MREVVIVLTGALGATGCGGVAGCGGCGSREARSAAEPQFATLRSTAASSRSTVASSAEAPDRSPLVRAFPVGTAGYPWTRGVPGTGVKGGRKPAEEEDTAYEAFREHEPEPAMDRLGRQAEFR